MTKIIELKNVNKWFDKFLRTLKTEGANNEFSAMNLLAAVTGLCLPV